MGGVVQVGEGGPGDVAVGRVVPEHRRDLSRQVGAQYGLLPLDKVPRPALAHHEARGGVQVAGLGQSVDQVGEGVARRQRLGGHDELQVAQVQLPRRRPLEPFQRLRIPVARRRQHQVGVLRCLLLPAAGVPDAWDADGQLDAAARFGVHAQHQRVGLVLHLARGAAPGQQQRRRDQQDQQPAPLPRQQRQRRPGLEAQRVQHAHRPHDDHRELRVQRGAAVGQQGVQLHAAVHPRGVQGRGHHQAQDDQQRRHRCRHRQPPRHVPEGHIGTEHEPRAAQGDHPPRAADPCPQDAAQPEAQRGREPAGAVIRPLVQQHDHDQRHERDQPQPRRRAQGVPAQSYASRRRQHKRQHQHDHRHVVERDEALGERGVLQDVIGVIDEEQRQRPPEQGHLPSLHHE